MFCNLTRSFIRLDFGYTVRTSNFCHNIDDVNWKTTQNELLVKKLFELNYMLQEKSIWIFPKYGWEFIFTRKYPLSRYILGVLTPQVLRNNTGAFLKNQVVQLHPLHTSNVDITFFLKVEIFMDHSNERGKRQKLFWSTWHTFN